MPHISTRSHKIIKFGNSFAITLDKAFFFHVGWRPNKSLFAIYNTYDHSITLKQSLLSPEQEFELLTAEPKDKSYTPPPGFREWLAHFLDEHEYVRANEKRAKK